MQGQLLNPQLQLSVTCSTTASSPHNNDDDDDEAKLTSADEANAPWLHVRASSSEINLVLGFVNSLGDDDSHTSSATEDGDDVSTNANPKNEDGVDHTHPDNGDCDGDDRSTRGGDSEGVVKARIYKELTQCWALAESDVSVEGSAGCSGRRTLTRCVVCRCSFRGCGWLVGWLVGYLVGWLTDTRTHTHTHTLDVHSHPEPSPLAMAKSRTATARKATLPAPPLPPPPPPLSTTTSPPPTLLRTAPAPRRVAAVAAGHLERNEAPVHEDVPQERVRRRQHVEHDVPGHRNTNTRQHHICRITTTTIGKTTKPTTSHD